MRLHTNKVERSKADQHLVFGEEDNVGVGDK